MAKRALVIANGQYDDARFPALPAAQADAAALVGVLSDPTIGEFTVEQLMNVGQRAAMRAIQVFFAGAQREDLLLLHLSLHGWKDLHNRLYFVASDTERDLLEATAISADFVSERMSRSKSGRIVLLLDCCYSGAFTAGMLRRSIEPPQVDVAEPFAGRGRMVLTASTSLQFAHEREPDVRLSRDQAQPSLFTAAVVQGLTDGSADLDSDGLIAVGELYEYVHDQVRRKMPGQTPTLSVDSVQGTIYLARNPRFVQSDELAELRAAAADQQAWIRVGALHLIERLLGSVREPVRDAAEQALLRLIADPDLGVARQARQLWHKRGLGDIPELDRPSRPQESRLVRSGFQAGIDFGTTNSAIGVFLDGDVRLIPNIEGALNTPSVVGFVEGTQPLVGMAAKRQAISNPKYTVASVKLKLGTEWSIECAGKRYSSEEIAAFILARLRADAEAYFGDVLTGAVLTVPAYFSYPQRYSLLRAAEIAEIKVLRIINEPTAASITYGLNRTGDQTVLMFDLGGGTFDVSLIEVGQNVCEVKATSGDNHLGGDNWDQELADYLVRFTRREYGVDVSRDALANQRLKEASEAAKIELSSTLSTHIWLPYLAVTQAGPVHLDYTLRRAEFEEITKKTLDRCRAPIEQVMADGGIKPSNLSHIILVGGATRMPAVAKLVHELTGRMPYRGLIPEGVVTGAALQAGVLKGQLKDFLLLDAIPLSLGIETQNGAFSKVIERNTTIPTKRSEMFTTNYDNQESITFHVLEGEREVAKGNTSLAVFTLTDLALGLKNRPKVEVIFDIDANGVLKVDARDLSVGRVASVTVNWESAASAVQHRLSRSWPTTLRTTPVTRNMWISADDSAPFREVGHDVPPATAVAVTGEGKIVSGGDDGVVRLWDPHASGDPGQELGHHDRGPIFSVAVTGEGKIVSGGDDGVVRLWDPHTSGDPGQELGHHADRRVLAVAVTKEGKIVSGGDDGVLRLWDPHKPGDPGHELGHHTKGSWVFALAVTEKGKIVSGGTDGVVRLWDPHKPGDSGQEDLGHHAYPATAVAVTGAGKVVSGYGDGLVCLWDPRIPRDTGQELGHHNDRVAALVVTRQLMGLGGVGFPRNWGSGGCAGGHGPGFAATGVLPVRPPTP